MPAATPNYELRTIEKKALAYYRSCVDKYGAPPSTAALAAHLGVVATGAKYILLCLGKKGFVEVKEEGRVTRLRLTLKGKRHPL
jgi:DNA-binding MarR family transcriptional regulator